MSNIVDKVTLKFPGFNFIKGTSFTWDPNHLAVYYPDGTHTDTTFLHGLMHEISHGILGHFNFKNDIELIKMERDAWRTAIDLLIKEEIEADIDHIENCLNSYRDWLYARSRCPQCGLVSIQTEAHTYSCIHCRLDWRVPSSRLCNVKRKILA